MLLPKFHCDINPIERCWAQAKRYEQSHTNYTLAGLRKNVPDGLDSVSLTNICNHFRKVRHYNVWLPSTGVKAGPELEEHVKKSKKICITSSCWHKRLIFKMFISIFLYT